MQGTARGVASRWKWCRLYSTRELNDAFTYCVQVVRIRDFENYVWCTQLPKELRPGIFALRAFNVETASVVERAGEGKLFAQMRFQWWLDAISNLYRGQPAANPVFKALAVTLQSRQLTRYRLRKIVETRQSDALREGPFEKLSDLMDYADGTAGQLLQLQLEVGQLDDAKVQEAAVLVGRAVGIANVLRGTAHHAKRGGLYFPKELLERYGVPQSAILAQETSREAQEMTRDLVKRANDAIDQARRLRPEFGESRAACGLLLPATVAEVYLTALRRAQHNPFDPSLLKYTQGYLQLKLQILIKLRSVLGRF